MKKLLLALVALFVLAGCSFAETRDFEGAPLRDPDESVVFSNVDGHPNLVRSCIDGVAFVTTTREYENVFRIPEWDEFCASIDRDGLTGGRQGDTGLDPEVAPETK